MNRLDLSFYSEHTPGPWVMVENPSGRLASRSGYVFRKPPDGERPRGRLAFIYSDKDRMMRGELESNERLIRDCPVILDALRDAYAEIDRLNGEKK